MVAGGQPAEQLPARDQGPVIANSTEGRSMDLNSLPNDGGTEVWQSSATNT